MSIMIDVRKKDFAVSIAYAIALSVRCYARARHSQVDKGDPSLNDIGSSTHYM